MSKKDNPILHVKPEKISTLSVEEIISINRDFWDERSDIHSLSDLYNLKAFVENKQIRIDAYQLEEMGPIAGKDIVHLQCHLGTESISLSHLGARVVGLDFSSRAIKIAQTLAEQCGVNTEFVEASVYDAPSVLNNRKFDIVYVNVGSIRCLPDLASWAKTVKEVLRPSGMLYMEEIHPLVATMADNTPTMVLDYFDIDARMWEEKGSYSDLPAQRINSQTVHNREIGFDRTLGEVITTIIQAGMEISHVKERAGHPNQVFDYLSKHENGKFYAPEGTVEVPATYTLKAINKLTP